MTARIGIILSTTRQARFAEKPAKWLKQIADQRTDLSVEIVDLRDFPLPFFDEDLPPARRDPQNPDALRWSQKLDELDGYIVVCAEYNHGIPAVLKNALDFAVASSLARKPIACVGYGGAGAARAIEQLRLVAIELAMVPTRTGVHITTAEYLAALNGQSFDEFPYLLAKANELLEELNWWTKLMTQARNQHQKS